MSDTHEIKSTNPASKIDYGLFLDCVHCGLCTASCPTYVELGNENDSPRGRIYLMRAVADERIEATAEVKRHLDLCLDCRACESACPSGVQYGNIIEPFRLAMQEQAVADGDPPSWLMRKFLFDTFPYPKKLRRALAPARWLQRLGLDWIIRTKLVSSLLPKPLDRMSRMLPKLKPEAPPLPEFFEAKGTRRAKVALFTGCIGSVMFDHTQWATVRVLQENGCDVVVPRNQVCCGAIHFHAGESEPAKEFADQNVTAFDIPDIDAVIVNVAGCGAMLKEYGHHWQDEGQPARKQLEEKIRDVNEFLDELGLIPPKGKISLTATYHDACHLAHAQQIRQQPRNLLEAIPGLKLIPLPESELCCGAAGTYNMTQPEMSDRLSQRKMDNIISTSASAAITANAGCALQIEQQARSQGVKLDVYHPMDLLDMSYREVSL
ncbi:MAG: hypothetical protein COA78_03645 [Blastopirellula sp.]|nr:MAG: hypothetical protein COA78_03645 [Blastopirellula sp.]